MYAKTLYLPVTPKEWEKRLRETDTNKLPAFFEYAKGKAPCQITKRGDGVVDRIYYSVCDYKFKFDKSVVGRFEPEMLMYESLKQYGEEEEKIVKHFRKEAQKLYPYARDVSYFDDDKYFYFIKKLRKDMQQFGSTQKVTDVLIHGMFIEHSVRRKSVFWDCFGDVVEMNLNNNLRERRGRCVCCGKRFKSAFGVNEIICPKCRPQKMEPVRTAECSVCGGTFVTRDTMPISTCPVCRMIKNSKSKCVDCGTPIYNSRGKGRRSCRCADCQSARNKEKVREWKIKYRQKKQ